MRGGRTAEDRVTQPRGDGQAENETRQNADNDVNCRFKGGVRNERMEVTKKRAKQTSERPNDDGERRRRQTVCGCLSNKRATKTKLTAQTTTVTTTTTIAMAPKTAEMNYPTSLP